MSEPDKGKNSCYSLREEQQPLLTLFVAPACLLHQAKSTDSDTVFAVFPFMTRARQRAHAGRYAASFVPFWRIGTSAVRVDGTGLMHHMGFSRWQARLQEKECRDIPVR